MIRMSKEDIHNTIGACLNEHFMIVYPWNIFICKLTFERMLFYERYIFKIEKKFIPDVQRSNIIGLNKYFPSECYLITDDEMVAGLLI